MSETITVSREVAAEVLECLRHKFQDSLQRARDAADEAARLESAIAEMELKINAGKLPLAGGDKPRKRMPKGYGEEAVLKLLESLPAGTGLPIAEIVTRTGVKQTTVFRALNEPKQNKGRFIQGSNGEWTLKR